jgi:spermidine/putrescine transport system substrate-binding protein
MPLTRRQFLYSAAGLLLTGCGSTGGGQKAANQLNIYGWADYLDDNVIPEFEKKTGIKVIYDTFASNEALLAKVEAGGSDYDLILPSNYAVAKLRKGGYLKPIDKTKLPNFNHLMERFQNPGFDPHCQYSVPYMFGTTGIGFNKKAFPGGNYPRDWDAFWDKKLAGRMTLLEDARETLGFALKHRGCSYNSTDPALIAQACNDLIAQKPLVMCYSSDQVAMRCCRWRTAATSARRGVPTRRSATSSRRQGHRCGWTVSASPRTRRMKTTPSNG